MADVAATTFKQVDTRADFPDMERKRLDWCYAPQ